MVSPSVGDNSGMRVLLPQNGIRAGAGPDRTVPWDSASWLLGADGGRSRWRGANHRGAAFLGAVTDAMLLGIGTWSSRIGSGPLSELTLWCVIWPLEMVVLLWPTGMLSPCRDRSMTATGPAGLVLGACARPPSSCAASPELALKERAYSAVMAAPDCCIWPSSLPLAPTGGPRILAADGVSAAAVTRETLSRAPGSPPGCCCSTSSTSSHPAVLSAAHRDESGRVAAHVRDRLLVIKLAMCALLGLLSCWCSALGDTRIGRSDIGLRAVTAGNVIQLALH